MYSREDSKEASLFGADGHPHSDDGGNVKVMCRFRPLNDSEKGRGGSNVCCEFHPSKKSVTINMSKRSGDNFSGSNKFTFDRVFDTDTSQREVYESAAKPIIDGVLQGFNGTIFAYGQTGSGKTFTMQGPNIEDLQEQGIVPRMVRTVFSRIDNMSENVEFSIKVSMAEIYMEKIRDLLDETKVDLKVKQSSEKGIYIDNLTERYIGSSSEVYEIMNIGNNHRKVASTSMNDQSSRSHSIFIMHVNQTNLDDGSSISGKLYLVDLAGSEKVAKTNVKGTQLDEAKGINKSLSTLGKVINALTDKKQTHIPYRESKLTRILSESLGGNAKTCLVITCSPSPWNELETMSTLRFGTAARNIKNKPKVNKEYTPAELKRMLNASQKRVRALEQFILDNNLEIPSNEDIGRLSSHLASTNQSISDIQEIPDMEDDDIERDDLKSTNLLNFEKDIGELDRTSLAELEASQEKLNELKETLSRERERFNSQLDKMNTLKEDYEILKDKFSALESHKTKVELEKNSLVFKIQGCTDQIEEKDEIINLQEVKIKGKSDEIKEYKSKMAKLMVTLNKYESGKDTKDEEKVESFSEPNNSKDSGENTLKFKKEIVALRHILGLKDEILDKLKETEDLTEEEKDRISITRGMLDEIDRAAKKYTKSGSKKAKYKDIDTDTLPLSESEIEQIVLNQKMIHSCMDEELAQKYRHGHLEDSKDIDTSKISQHEFDEKLQEMKDQFEQEKEHLIKDLGNRVQKVCNLELEIDLLRDEYKRLERSLTEEDFSLKTQVEQLQRQVDHIDLMYHHEVTNNNVLKVDAQMYEKKIQKRDQRIALLEKSYKKLSEQTQTMKNYLKNLQKQMIQVQAPKREAYNTSGVPSNGRLIKKIKPGAKVN
ncbi:unnamed protein product [Moneuplotes crassus]|uniref:Kinesin-like protein n=2 Tax=Euplotes crassus TaxID=5936 RepID=A0AAD1XRQ7_EUPCR|nr:unnamed protein product [Moneuplotes crassus]